MLRAYLSTQAPPCHKHSSGEDVEHVAVTTRGTYSRLWVVMVDTRPPLLWALLLTHGSPPASLLLAFACLLECCRPGES